MNGQLNNVIYIRRGDTYEFNIMIEDSTSETGYYQLVGDDAVYLGIMDPKQPFEEALVKKKYTKDDMSTSQIINVVIESDDTLDLFPGVYYYSVKLHLDHTENSGEVDKVKTLIDKAKFIIGE